MFLWRLPVAICVAGVLAGMAPAALAQRQADGPTVEIGGKIDSATGHLLIPVAFNGRSVWCALDTGFSALLVVDSLRALSIGLTTHPPQPLPDGSAPSKTDLSASTEVGVGTVSLGTRNIIIRDLPDEAPEMECIVGASALRQYVIEMDYEQARVRLIPPPSYTPLAGSTEVPLVFRSNPNVPFIPVTLRFADGSEQRVQLVADTGTAGFAALIADPAAARMRSPLGATAALTQVPKGPSGPVQISAARPAALLVGPFTINQPVIALLESDFGSGGFDDGLLGCGFFNRFTIAFDFQGKRMLLRPNRRFAEPHLFDASGAGLRHERDTFIVERVLPSSAAERAGLRSGDAIIAVDDRPAAELNLLSIRDSLSRPGETRRLRVRRNGEAVSITLVLTKRL